MRRLAVLRGAGGDVPLLVVHQAQRPHVLRVGQELGVCLGKSWNMDGFSNSLCTDKCWF